MKKFYIYALVGLFIGCGGKSSSSSGGSPDHAPYVDGVAGSVVALELWTLQQSLAVANMTSLNAKIAVASVVCNRDQLAKLKALKAAMDAAGSPEEKAIAYQDADNAAGSMINSGANERKKLSKEQINLVLSAATNLLTVVAADKVALETAKKLPDSVKGAIEECKSYVSNATNEMKSNPFKAAGIAKKAKGVKMNLTFLTAAASSTIPSMPGDIAGQMQNIASVLASVGKLAKGNSFDAPTSVSAGTTATDLNISFD